MSRFCQLQLTCADKAEATKIANTLLVKHLVACVKQIPISSAYWWQGKIESSDEVLLLMDSKPDNFEQIEKEVAKLHSYETFVLQQLPIDRVSAESAEWLKENLNG